MKRLTLKRPELPILAVLAAVLLIGYQNCSNKMSFEGSSAAGKLVTDGGQNDDIPGGTVPDPDGIPDGDFVGDNNPPNSNPPQTSNPPNVGDGSPIPGSSPTPGGTNPVPNPDMPRPGTPIGILPMPDHENDGDTPIDIDYGGKKIVFACSTGAASKMMSEDELKSAQDLTLSNVHASMIFYSRPIRYASLSNLHGSVGILNAWKITDASNIHDEKNGEVSYLRAYEIQRASNIHGRVATELTAMEIGDVSNIHGGSICASANRFDSFSNLHGGLIKIRGREDAVGGANATATDISNIHALFTSIYKVNMKSISNIHSDTKSGEIIIRDSVIDDMSNVRGGLTLINTRVKNLSNFKGVLRMLNSQIDKQSNTDYKEEPVITKK